MQYSIIKAVDGMARLRKVFPNPEDADELQFCLFSTGGFAHGSYSTIEEERLKPKGKASVTFLIVMPRTVTLQYGECEPTTDEDFEYLLKLREHSAEAVSRIGYPDRRLIPMTKEGV